MGCFSCFGRKKEAVEAADSDFAAPRIYNSATSADSAYSNIEKPPFAPGRPAAYPTAPVPAAIASLRPTANPRFSAYSGRAETDFDIYRGSAGYGGGSEKPNVSSTWAASPSSTQVSDLTIRTNDYKLKEDDVDDPEEQMRKRKAEEARRKAEREEQERLDFLQWM